MKVSVITVCLNSEATIIEALQSVATQTHPDVEHIIVDGGSEDGTVMLVKEFARNGSVVLSEPDNGIYHAMNKGLRLASGEVLCFLNADDFYKSADTLALVNTMILENKLDVLYGDVDYVHPNDLTTPVRRYSSKRFSPDRLEWGWMPAHPALFLKREVLTKYGEFCEDYQIAGDFEFVARIFHTQKLNYQYVPEVFVRMRTGGISNRSIRSFFLLNLEVLRACRANGIKTNIIKILAKYPFKLIEKFNV